MPTRELDDLIDAVALKGHIAKADIQSEIIEWLNEAYMELADLDLSCFETTASLTLLNGVSSYVISTAIGTNVRNLISIYSTEGIIDLIEPHRAKNIYFNNLSDPTSNSSSCYPNVAWEYHGSLYVDPTPDQSYSVYVDYFQIPVRITTLTGAGSTFLLPEHKEILLINYAKDLLDAREKDWDSSDRIKSDFLRKARKWEITDKKRYGRQTTLIELQRQYNETYNGGK